MNRIAWGCLIVLLGLTVATAEEPQDKPATPAEQYQALLKEFNEAAALSFRKDATDEEKAKVAARMEKLPPRLVELAEKYPEDPIALDALVWAVAQEIYLENNTSHPGYGKDSPEARAIAIVLRDHVQSDRLSEACRRVRYGFRRECETLLRTVLEKNPHREIQGRACLWLAQFLNARLQRLDLLKEQPELAKRYEGLFGKDYLEALQRRDRAKAAGEAEAFFERAAEKYGDVKLPYGGTVGEQAESDLYEIRHLSVGKEAPDIEGEDQDGQRFKLSDYRGKVVLLYFWQQF